MRDLIMGILTAYCAICALILLCDLPAWVIGPAAIGAMIGVLLYIAWDLRRALRWRRVARRISE